MKGAIKLDRHGGPDALRWVDESDDATGEPGPDEVRLRHTAIGVNFIDTYHRTGLYPVSLPSGIGMEAAGIIEAVGARVADFAPGDRVAYADIPFGAYAETRITKTDRLIKLPAAISDEIAGAMMLRGLTAWYLIHKTRALHAGDTILLHAAAGGVGLILAQWAKHIGATVIGTAGSAEKVALAAAHGCDHPVLYTEDDFVARVREITGGAGVPVVYDSVGAATFEGSLDCLAPRGLMVSFGNASGPVPPVSLLDLSRRGSLFITRPTLAHYVPDRQSLQHAADALFEVVASGAVRIRVGQTFPLREAAEAHRALEARRTTGSTLLLP